jgi:hypothetical protein
VLAWTAIRQGWASGNQVYELAIGKAGRFPLVGLLEPASPDKVGTVAEQDAYFRRWRDGPKNRD